MIKKIIHNILYSGLEQIVLLIAQFLSSILIIRNIPRADYGLLGVIVGYYVFFNVLNITVESVLVRDHQLYGNRINKYLRDFCGISLVKNLAIGLLSCLLSVTLYYFYRDVKVFYAVGINYVVLAGQALVSPLIQYYVVKFNQKLVTRISIIRTFLRLSLLVGLIYYQSMLYYFTVEITVNLLFCVIWFVVAKKQLDFGFLELFKFKSFDWKFIKDVVLHYSMWTHLTGVTTNFVYRSDTFFLSFFVGLIAIGDYNIALTSSNIASIASSILGYQNSVSLSNVNTKEEIEKITNGFLKVSIYLGLVTFLTFVVFGKFYLQLITGEENITEIYYYMLFIVSGLILIKTIATPLVALINMKGSVKDFFKRVSMPLLIIIGVCYTLSAYFYGVMGVAIANLINSFFWLGLILIEFKKLPYKFRIELNIAKDIQLILNKFVKNA